MTVLFKKDLTGVNTLDRTVPINVAAATSWLANTMVDEVRDNWSADSPSSPGEAPAVVTGTLDASVVSEAVGRDVMGRFTSKDAIMRVVRIGAPYSGFLEHGTSRMLARPYLLPAALRTYDRMPEAYKGVISLKINQKQFSGGSEE